MGIEEAGGAEVDKNRAAVVGDHDVVGLQITVEQATAVDLNHGIRGPEDPQDPKIPVNEQLPGVKPSKDNQILWEKGFQPTGLFKWGYTFGTPGRQDPEHYEVR